jgi:RHS repeat-associated protein
MAKTRFVWDPVSDSVLQEKDGNTGVTQATYTSEPTPYGPLRGEHRGTETHQYHFDALGSTRALTNDSQAVTDTYAYDAWGVDVSHSTTIDTPFRWNGRTGYTRDRLVNSVYVRNRVARCDLSVWLSSDPISFADYGYASNSPVRRIDPSGLVCTLSLPPLISVGPVETTGQVIYPQRSRSMWGNPPKKAFAAYDGTIKLGCERKVDTFLVLNCTGCCLSGVIDFRCKGKWKWWTHLLKAPTKPDPKDQFIDPKYKQNLAVYNAVIGFVTGHSFEYSQDWYVGSGRKGVRTWYTSSGTVVDKAMADEVCRLSVSGVPLGLFKTPGSAKFIEAAGGYSVAGWQILDIDSVSGGACIPIWLGSPPPVAGTTFNDCAVRAGCCICI